MQGLQRDALGEMVHRRAMLRDLVTFVGSFRSAATRARGVFNGREVNVDDSLERIMRQGLWEEALS